MKKKNVCLICHLILSLEEEATKHPSDDGWIHRTCYEKWLKGQKRKKPIGFDPSEGL